MKAKLIMALYLVIGLMWFILGASSRGLAPQALRRNHAAPAPGAPGPAMLIGLLDGAPGE